MTDSLLARAETVHSKVAAASVLWKYADPDGNEFYLLKKLTPVRSPYSGKSFTVKPERVSLSDVGKELKSDAKAEKAKKADEGDFWKAAFFAEPVEVNIDLNTEIPVEDLALNKLAADAKGKTLPGTLWEYADDDGNKFYLPKKQTGALKSPFTGKTFTGKPVKNTLSDVGKDLKQEAKSKKASEQDEQAEEGHEKAADQEQQKEASEDLWKVDPAFGVLAQEEKPEQAEEGQQKTACEGGQCKCSGQCGCSPSAEQEQKKEATNEAEAILAQGESHPALKALLAAYQDVVATVATANSVKAAADGVPDLAAALVLARVKPAVEKLARVSAIVAKQMEAKIK